MAAWAPLAVMVACGARTGDLAGDGSLDSIPGPEREAFASRCHEITDEHRRLWLKRNRPGGLNESAAWLVHLENCYRRGEAPQGWFGPLG